MTNRILECVLIGLILLVPVFLLVRQHRINRAPVYTGAATVVSRRVLFHTSRSVGWNYLVTFQLGDGDTLELYTTEAEYGRLKEGLHGMLSWQEQAFCRFDEDN